MTNGKIVRPYHLIEAHSHHCFTPMMLGLELSSGLSDLVSQIGYLCSRGGNFIAQTVSRGRRFRALFGKVHESLNLLLDHCNGLGQ